MRTVIFDLDGTLADTSGDLIAAANACFGGLGLGAPLDPSADQATAFRGGRAMLRLGFERARPGWAEADIDAQFPLLLDAYARQIDVFTALYPGALEAVERLCDAGFAVGICTNKPEGLAETLLARLGIRDRFASLIGADTLPVRKPDPAPLRAAVERAGGSLTRAMLVGDTVTDRETARAAGVPCALVTFGPEGGAVAALKPEALLDDFDSLFDVAARLLPG
ncbi:MULTISPECIES: HAD-IA family hydrolase [Actibacterium]|uniref:phosphoglycolate phosphatase n=1 Tax=Actibacterium naphthalenivorans TaxID=1614693 RepID=A0A840C6D9_9RHOB|nr:MULTISPECIES: HAD-IA family hydrolase [Actibacterium]ALG89876.1 haloacid dehalogenase [Actibacterium sp. EMB200-NS6]MBB4020403.1 phosphoglycolate phosphatase [Actibacterium naphthalenivorans]